MADYCSKVLLTDIRASHDEVGNAGIGYVEPCMQMAGVGRTQRCRARVVAFSILSGTDSPTYTAVVVVPSATIRCSVLGFSGASKTSMTTGAGNSVSLAEVVPSQSLCSEMRAMSETAITASALRCACSEGTLGV